MLNNSSVKARINNELKKEASIVLSQIGLTLSDAFRMMIIRIVKEKGLPFSPLIPNKKTIEAIEAARRGKLFGSVDIDNFLSELNAED
jgi:DNA-damage-inducible protein J